MKNQKGFSLIELLIVVVIIGIIAAIAIPNLLAARRSANEGSAISSLRTTHGAQITYQATAGNGSYAVNYAALGTANIIDTTLASGTKSGFSFATSSVAANSGRPAYFAATAKPVTPSGLTQTGTRDFAIATEGVIYAAATGGIAATTANTGTFSGGSALSN